jgi:hypothetical protein
MKRKVYKTKVNTRDELLVRILDAAARIEKRKYQVRLKKSNLRTRVAKCIEADGGILERLL